MNWSKMMKINDVQQILDITNSEWNIYYELITTSLKTSTLSHMPFFNQIDNVQSISLYSLYPLLFRKEFQLSDQNLKALIPFSHNHFTSLFILDKIYDSQKVEEPIDLLILLEQYSKNMMFLSNEIHPDVTENICKTLTGLYSKLNLKQYTMWYNILMAYSIDFRKKVLAYCERTGSITEASHIFQISRNTIYGWLKLKEKTGDLNHQVKGTKPRKVDRDRLKNYLTDNPDAYLTEIAAEFGCHPTTIHYALKAMGYTRKKESHLL